MEYSYMPIGIDIAKRRCLIVGGGEVALRKIDTLLDFGTDITVIAPEPIDKICFYAEKKRLHLEKRKYTSPEVKNFGIVIAASDDNEVNETVAGDCRDASIPVNVVDNPGLCDFIFPSVLKRDCLTISVLSDAQAPFLSGHLRMVLENIFAEKRWVTIAQLASVFRRRVNKTYADNQKLKAASFANFLDNDWQKTLEEVPDEELSDFLDTLMESENRE
jgi:siroheme synthase-like protein